VFQIVEFLKIREKGWHSKAGTPLEQLSWSKVGIILCMKWRYKSKK
jgi:hypothetical protein